MKEFLHLASNDISALEEKWMKFNTNCLKRNPKEYEFFSLSIGFTFALQRDDLNSAFLYLNNIRNRANDFIDPQFQHLIDYFRAQFLFAGKKWKDLEKFLEEKLATLKEKGIVKNCF